MMRNSTLILAALACGLSALPVAATPIGVSPVAAAEQPVDRLVGVMVPEESLLRLALTAFDQGLREQIDKDSVAKLAAARNPDMFGAITAQLRGGLAQAMKAETPALRAEIRAVLVSELTPAEIGDVLAFFESPTGQKLRAQVYETMAGQPGRSPDEIRQAATAAAMASMTTEDYPALMAFGASSAATKMQTINPRVSAISEAWSKRLVEKYTPQMRAQAQAAIAQYVKDHK